MTENGIAQVKGTGEALVAPGKIIDPSNMAHVFTSPRQRAIVTLEIPLGTTHKKLLEEEHKMTVTEDMTEWDYGSWGGSMLYEIKESRANRGLAR